MKHIKYTSLLLILTVLIACKPDTKPRLLVLLSVDHFSYDTYSHYRSAFTGGFHWLDQHGISFENTSHEHGYTATGPGHFVLGSGLYPGPAGILGNNWYDRIQKKSVYCVDDPQAKALSIPANSVSYNPINGTSFGDWLKAASPESKVYAVSCKDRAAIMLGGKHPDLAVWYNWQGSFTTTDYYTDSIPGWLADFNTEAQMLSYRDSLWTPAFPEAFYHEYTRADSFFGETDRYDGSVYSPVFPIGFDADWDDAKVLSRLGGYPWMDRMTLELASLIIDEGELGQDDTPDVLNIGLSVMDLVAHYYGPHSREVGDHIMRVDQYLQDFLNRLDKQVGLENVVIAMTADHGGLPLPEYQVDVLGKPGGRVDEKHYLAVRGKAYAELDSLYGNHDFIHRKGSSYYYDHTLMAAMSVSQSVVDSILQTNMESVEGVHRLYTKQELLVADDSDFRKNRLKHFMHPELSPDLYTLVDYGWIFRNPWGTSHSTPYDYDSHVPLVIAKKSTAPRSIENKVSTTDVAPTLSAILGVKPTNPIDGVSRVSLLNHP